MHTLRLTLCVISLLTFGSTAALANNNNQSCRRLFDKCKIAGFRETGDFYVNCLLALKFGKPVFNVPGDDPDVQACLASPKKIDARYTVISHKCMQDVQQITRLCMTNGGANCQQTMKESMRQCKTVVPSACGERFAGELKQCAKLTDSDDDLVELDEDGSDNNAQQ